MFFDEITKMGHEQVNFFSNPDVGLKSIVAIHDTTLGPALGGCRFLNYKSDEEALNDVLRLSQGMTYKAAVAGLNLGGGKAVIIGDPKELKSEGLFRAFGRFLQTLNGRYITAEDVGTDVTDMEYVYMETPHVVGVAETSGGSGDPSPFTAMGVIQGMKACLKEKRNSESFEGITVAVQGLGHVGYHLLRNLINENCKIIATDISSGIISKVKDEFSQVEIVKNEEIYDVKCDIFSPNALGAVINDDTIPRLKCTIVAGAANNVLKHPEDGLHLEKRGILYAPDYAINAGGLMNVSIELEGYNQKRAVRMIRNIYYNLSRIFRIAKEDNIPTYLAADRLAEQRLTILRKIKAAYIGGTQSPRSIDRRRKHSI